MPKLQATCTNHKIANWLLRITLVLSMVVCSGHYLTTQSGTQEPTQTEVVLSKSDSETNRTIAFEKVLDELARGQYLCTSIYVPDFALIYVNQWLDTKFKVLTKKTLSYNRNPMVLPILRLYLSSDDEAPTLLIG